MSYTDKIVSLMIIIAAFMAFNVGRSYGQMEATKQIVIECQKIWKDKK